MKEWVAKRVTELLGIEEEVRHKGCYFLCYIGCAQLCVAAAGGAKRVTELLGIEEEVRGVMVLTCFLACLVCSASVCCCLWCERHVH